VQRPPTRNGITQAARRPLKIFASDPLLGRTFGNRARIDVANEPLTTGPIGRRVEVLDYDGAQKCFYTPVDLDNPAILMQGGLEPSESDPRFHQQMVYAVAIKTLENFDRALGRVLRLGSQSSKRGIGYPRLRLFPHAFYGANAFYNPEIHRATSVQDHRDAPLAALPRTSGLCCLTFEHEIRSRENAKGM
jgi:hypothetical protein